LKASSGLNQRCVAGSETRWHAVMLKTTSALIAGQKSIGFF
jgi:hypothetical protein